MRREQTLTSLYIRGGINWFNKSIDSSLAKKKHRKGGADTEEICFQHSVFNFISLDNIKRPQFFLLREQLKYYRKDGNKKQQSSILQRRLAVQEDIEKFRVLNKKIIKRPQFELQRQQSFLNRQKIVYQQIKKWFLDGELDNMMQENQQKVKTLKKAQGQHDNSFSSSCNQKISMFKSGFESFMEAKQLLESISIGKIKRPQVPNNNIEKKVNWLISSFLDSLFDKVANASQFKELLVKSRITKEWDSRKLFEDKAKLTSMNIKGKHFYAAEEQITKQKKELRGLDISRQYFIRQKRYGIHQAVNKKSHDNNVSTSNCYRREQKIRGQSLQQRQEKYKINKKETLFKEQLFDPPKSKSQLNPEQPKKEKEYINSEGKRLQLRYFDASNISDLKQQVNQSKSRRKSGSTVPANIQQFRNKFKKPSPLSLDNINRFAYQGEQLLARKGESNKELRVIKTIKYPIKFEVLELYSPESSMICYHIDEICLKKLSLRFIEDRLKYKQNRVKIEYPSRYSADQEQKVMKCMHILNCLGAEVTCDIQSSYTCWNEVDLEEVLIVSWMLEMPVREVVRYYSSYLTSTITKRI